MKHVTFMTTLATLPLATCEKSKEAPAGMDPLHAAALRGNNAMPARGGNPLLAVADDQAAADDLAAQAS